MTKTLGLPLALEAAKRFLSVATVLSHPRGYGTSARRRRSHCRKGPRCPPRALLRET